VMLKDFGKNLEELVAQRAGGKVPVDAQAK
jgi:hypothetical protein